MIFSTNKSYDPLVLVRKVLTTLILFFCVTRSMAESDTLAVFNGIDYYSGRMVSGIGFSLNQTIQEKTGDQQTFEIVPAFYFNMDPSFAATVANTTAVRKIESSEETEYQSNPLSNQIRLGFQIRPVSSFQLFPYMEFFDSRYKYNEHFMGDWYKEDKIRNERYGLSGMWLSGGGTLSMTTEQLKWTHYFSEELPWVPAGKIMVTLDAGVETIKNQGFHKDLSQETAVMEMNADTKGKDIFINNSILYGLSEKWLVSLQSEYRNDSNDFSEYNSPDGNDTESSQKMHSYDVKPSLGAMIRDNVYVQWISRISDYTCKAETEDFGLRNIKQVNVPAFSTGLSAQWFIHTRVPDVDRFLANWNGLFGNRLPEGGWLITLQVLPASEKFHGTDEIVGIEGSGTDQDLELKELESELSVRFGLSDFIELEIKSKGLYKGIRNEENESALQWMPELSEQSADSRHWLNSAGVTFASYNYSNQFQNQYGWYKLSPFDQYYGSRLRPLMFRGRLGFSYVSYRKRDAVLADLSLNEEITKYTDWTGGFIDNQTWTTETAFQLGLWGNIELGCQGTFYKYSSDLRNKLDTDWRTELSVSWQPWKSLCIQFLQEAYRFADDVYIWPEDRFYEIYKVHQKTIHAWNIQIMSLF